MFWYKKNYANLKVNTYNFYAYYEAYCILNFLRFLPFVKLYFVKEVITQPEKNSIWMMLEARKKWMNASKNTTKNTDTHTLKERPLVQIGR